MRHLVFAVALAAAPSALANQAARLFVLDGSTGPDDWRGIGSPAERTPCQP